MQSLTISSDTHRDKGLYAEAVTNRTKELYDHMLLILGHMNKMDDSPLKEALSDAYGIMLKHQKDMEEWLFWEGGNYERILKDVLEDMKHERKT